MTDPHANALLQPWDGPLGAPPFDKVRDADFLPAFETAMAWHRDEIAAIAGADAPATFDTVIAALERSGEPLARVRRLFWTLSSAQATPGTDDAIRPVPYLMSAQPLFRTVKVSLPVPTLTTTPSLSQLVTESSRTAFATWGAAPVE